VEKSYQLEIKKFGLEVKRLREANSITQQQLADSCEVDIRTIQRIERGDVSVGLQILFSLADAFKLRPYQLLEKI
jgi:transcriptional regulator with XRE-family HTH domain